MSETENRIEKLKREIEGYQQAIEDAQNALAAAEQELNEELARQMEAKPKLHLV